MEVSGQLLALAALPPGKESRYPLERVGFDAEEKTELFFRLSCQ
jgi:hypothetical protein